MDVDKIDDVCSIHQHQDHHPVLYCGTLMKAKRIKTLAKLTGLEFVGNI